MMARWWATECVEGPLTPSRAPVLGYPPAPQRVPILGPPSPTRAGPRPETSTGVGPPFWDTPSLPLPPEWAPVQWFIGNNQVCILLFNGGRHSKKVG